MPLEEYWSYPNSPVCWHYQYYAGNNRLQLVALRVEADVSLEENHVTD